MWHLENGVPNITASVKIQRGKEILGYSEYSTFASMKVSFFLILMFFNENSRDGAERRKILPWADSRVQTEWEILMLISHSYSSQHTKIASHTSMLSDRSQPFTPRYSLVNLIFLETTHFLFNFFCCCCKSTLFNTNFADWLLHIAQFNSFENGKTSLLSYEQNCWGHNSFKEQQPKETPLQGCNSCLHQLSQNLQAPSKFWWPRGLSWHHSDCLVGHVMSKHQSWGCSLMTALFMHLTVF